MFYISIRCVFKTVFISEQITENWFGALLEISDKYISLKQFKKLQNYTV